MAVHFLQTKPKKGEPKNGFFEVEKRFEDEVKKGFRGAFFEGIKVHLDIAKPEHWSKEKEVYTGRIKKRKPFQGRSRS